MIQRGTFSVYEQVYEFDRRTPEADVLAVPCVVRHELLVAAILAPLFSVRLDRRPALDQLIATDAAPEFAFGVSLCRCTANETAEVCRLAERRGDYVRVTPDLGDLGEVSKIGKPRRLRHTVRVISTIVPKRAKWEAHSGAKEAHAHLLGLRWAT